MIIPSNVNTYGKWKVFLSHQHDKLMYVESMFYYYYQVMFMFIVQVIVNLPDEYYAQGYGAGYEAYTQVSSTIMTFTCLSLTYPKLGT